jgi:flagellar motor switch protein FliG
MSQISPAIRKAAVLVSALDERAADLLLEQMGADMSGKVRYALMLLGDISAEEQERVLNDFFAGNPPARGAGGSLPDDDVLLELSPQGLSPQIAAAAPAHVDAELTTPPVHSIPADDLLELLQSASAADLAQVLEHEPPQFIAVVLARLNPEQAASVLERLTPSVATDALEKLAWLGEPAPEAMAEIARHLQSKLAALAQRQPSVASVRVLLAAMDQSRRGIFLEHLASRDPKLASELCEGPDCRQTYQVESHRYRIERTGERPTRQDLAVASPLAERRREVPHLEFEDLERLDDATLRQVFAATDPQIVLLALTGADEGLLTRILRQLPPRDAAVLRSRLNNPGALRLSDIREAQDQLLDTARRLATNGSIVIHGSRSFAAAA